FRIPKFLVSTFPDFFVCTRATTASSNKQSRQSRAEQQKVKGPNHEITRDIEELQVGAPLAVWQERRNNCGWKVYARSRNPRRDARFRVVTSQRRAWAFARSEG